MSDNIDLKTRQQIANFLPVAILKTLNSYDDFTMDKEPTDSKDFSAHHSACKAAIAHLELLLKLAQWAKIPDENNQENQFLANLLAIAQERVIARDENYQLSEKIDH